MTISDNSFHLLFSCDCVSGLEENYSDPWAAIAKNRLLGGGTKEEILNLVARSPKTISQLAKALDLSPPSVFKHVNELLENELIRDSTGSERTHPKERYYEPNFPVVSAGECAEVEAVCNEMSDTIADLFENSLTKFEDAFQRSTLAEGGWSFRDVSQCLYAHIQRRTRRTLEDRGSLLPPQPHRNGVSWSFWAEKPSLEDSTTKD